MKNRPWMTDNRFAIEWSHWDKDGDKPSSVIYHTGSGDTHHLDILSSMILQIIESESVSTNDIARRLSILSELEADDDLYSYVETALSRFQNLNLITHSK